MTSWRIMHPTHWLISTQAASVDGVKATEA